METEDHTLSLIMLLQAQHDIKEIVSNTGASLHWPHTPNISFTSESNILFYLNAGCLALAQTLPETLPQNRMNAIATTEILLYIQLVFNLDLSTTIRTDDAINAAYSNVLHPASALLSEHYSKGYITIPALQEDWNNFSVMTLRYPVPNIAFILKDYMRWSNKTLIEISAQVGISGPRIIKIIRDYKVIQNMELQALLEQLDIKDPNVIEYILSFNLTRIAEAAQNDEKRMAKIKDFNKGN